MHAHRWCAAMALVASHGLVGAVSLTAQDARGGPEPTASARAMESDMWQADLGGGWRLAGMAQAFPIVTIGAPTLDNTPLNDTSWSLTQPAVMTNVEAPGGRVTLRTTLNFEGLTIKDGEPTFGGWGEGFIDRRHPHTLVHELMLSVNVWDGSAGGFSLSAGKGFAPYGTDDPMSRPVLKYPTNHHLSQVLERWTVNGALLRNGWGIEAGVFGGAEPDGPYDFSNIRSFGNSWSTRISKRWGSEAPYAGWEASTSYAQVVETLHETRETTRLWNGALAYSGAAGVARWALLEGSVSRGPGENDFFSVLGEVGFDRSGHQPYARIEYASRPEYTRGNGEGPGFFGYDHDSDPIGSTRWLIATAAYAYQITANPVSLRPFIEVQHFRVWEDRGGIDPAALFGSDSFWGLSLGMRIFLGGEPMRMGVYGVLDPMAAMSRTGGMSGSM